MLVGDCIRLDDGNIILDSKYKVKNTDNTFNINGGCWFYVGSVKTDCGIAVHKFKRVWNILKDDVLIVVNKGTITILSLLKSTSETLKYIKSLVNNKKLDYNFIFGNTYMYTKVGVSYGFDYLYKTPYTNIRIIKHKSNIHIIDIYKDKYRMFTKAGKIYTYLLGIDITTSTWVILSINNNLEVDNIIYTRNNISEYSNVELKETLDGITLVKKINEGHIYVKGCIE